MSKVKKGSKTPPKLRVVRSNSVNAKLGVAKKEVRGTVVGFALTPKAGVFRNESKNNRKVYTVKRAEEAGRLLVKRDITSKEQVDKATQKGQK